MTNPNPVLVLDGDQRSALAVTRSLGRSGLDVTVADSRARSLAGRSRYACSREVYPNPGKDPTAFIGWLESRISATPEQVVFPCTDLTLPLALQSPIVSQRVCGPRLDAYTRLSDKWTLFQACRTLGIPTPDTALVVSGGDMLPAVEGLEVPAVIKPRRSVIEGPSGSVRLPVTQVSSRPEMVSALGTLYPPGADLLIQSTVSGAGFGISAICNRGVPIAWFAHRRIREKPPSGGVSTLCESMDVPEMQRQFCEDLIGATAWHGPVMFEFKGTPGADAWLIEVNGRLWGSLQLAIDCGIDVPRLMFQVVIGEEPASVHRYRQGRQMRWAVGDFGRLYLALRRKQLPDPPPGRVRSVLEALAWHGGRGFTEDWRYGDSGPFLHQLRCEFDNLRLRGS